MGQIGVLASYKEITGHDSDLAVFRRTLEEYDLASLLACCCRLHILLRTWQNPQDYEAELRLLPRLLPAHLVRRIAQLGFGKFTAINRITLLFMTKEVILCARPGSKPIASQLDVERIGLCLLMANDLVLGYVPRPDDNLLQNVAGLVPFGDLLPRETPMEDIVRN